MKWDCHGSAPLAGAIRPKKGHIAANRSLADLAVLPNVYGWAKLKSRCSISAQDTENENRHSSSNGCYGVLCVSSEAVCAGKAQTEKGCGWRTEETASFTTTRNGAWPYYVWISRFTWLASSKCCKTRWGLIWPHRVLLFTKNSKTIRFDVEKIPRKSDVGAFYSQMTIYFFQIHGIIYKL